MKKRLKDFSCIYCKHAGKVFRLFKRHAHCHCEHPDPNVHVWGEEVSEYPSGWATLRSFNDTCKKFKSKESEAVNER